MGEYRHFATFPIDRNPVPVLPASAFRTVMRSFPSTGRIELTGEDGVTRHFQMIRESDKVCCAKLEGDRIVPIDIGELKMHMQLAIGQIDGAKFDRPIGGDGEVRQADSPDDDEAGS